jgi:hypothetical protein
MTFLVTFMSIGRRAHAFGSETPATRLRAAVGSLLARYDHASRQGTFLNCECLGCRLRLLLERGERGVALAVHALRVVAEWMAYSGCQEYGLPDRGELELERDRLGSFAGADPFESLMPGAPLQAGTGFAGNLVRSGP